MQVYLAELRMVGPQAAVKVARKGYETVLWMEWWIAMAIPFHVGLLRPIGAVKDDTHRWASHLALPLCQGGTLAALLAKFTKTSLMPVMDGLALLRDVLSALAHMHRHGFVHRDIKPANILFWDAACRHPVVGDFGWSAREGTKYHTMLGTVGYAPPEAMLLGCDPAAAQAGCTTHASFDMWSFCIVAGEVVLSEDPTGVITLLATGQLAPRLLERLDSNLVAGIMRGLSGDPAMRISADDLLGLFTHALGTAHLRVALALLQPPMAPPAPPPPHQSAQLTILPAAAAGGPTPQPQPAADGTTLTRPADCKPVIEEAEDAAASAPVIATASSVPSALLATIEESDTTDAGTARLAVCRVCLSFLGSVESCVHGWRCINCIKPFMHPAINHTVRAESDDQSVEPLSEAASATAEAPSRPPRRGLLHRTLRRLFSCTRSTAVE